MKYNYTPGLKRVLDALKDVRKAQTYRNLCDSGQGEVAQTMRLAYLVNLRTSLFVLSIALNDWMEKGARMEIGEEDKSGTTD